MYYNIPAEESGVILEMMKEALDSHKVKIEKLIEDIYDKTQDQQAKLINEMREFGERISKHLPGFQHELGPRKSSLTGLTMFDTVPSLDAKQSIAESKQVSRTKSLFISNQTVPALSIQELENFKLGEQEYDRAVGLDKVINLP